MNGMACFCKALHIPRVAHKLLANPVEVHRLRAGQGPTAG